MNFLMWWRKRLRKNYKKLRALHNLETRNPTVKFENDVIIRSPERLYLGKNIYISSGTVFECGGKAWCDYRGKITIGDHVYIGLHNILKGAGEIEIQRCCIISQNVSILSHAMDLIKIKK
jgi:acetyltransferase-like isoleucine patch superfamily enzyme